MEEGQAVDELHAGDAELCAGGGAERLAAEGETSLARLVMDGGDLPHAASHLGNAVAIDPLLPETHEALSELAARAGGPRAALALFPLENPYIGAVVCHAHLQAACGEWSEAVGLIAAAIRAEYDRPWSQVAWLTQDRLPDLLPPDVMTQALARAVGGALPDPIPEPARDALRPFYDLAAAVIARHPADARLAAIGSGLARRFGDTGRAVAWAEQARRAEPGHVASVMLGYALRAADRPDEAVRVWEEEIERDDSDLSLMVDIAELYTSTGRPAEGLAWAERAAAADPAHPQAAPAVHGVRFAADGAAVHLLALADHLRAHPDHGYAAVVLTRHSESRAWLGTVDQATEATVNVLHQILESRDAAPDREGPSRLLSSTVEPPSAGLAFRLAFPRAELSAESVGDPDPRVPVGDPDARWPEAGSAARGQFAAFDTGGPVGGFDGPGTAGEPGPRRPVGDAESRGPAADAGLRQPGADPDAGGLAGGLEALGGVGGVDAQGSGGDPGARGPVGGLDPRRPVGDAEPRGPAGDAGLRQPGAGTDRQGLVGGLDRRQPSGDAAPRRSAGGPRVQVWRYAGRDPYPAVPPPAAEASRLVQDTAAFSWPHVPAAYDHAVRLAGLALDDLLGVLVHPPLPPDDGFGGVLRDHRPELWVRGVQTFGCLGIAHHRTDQPWPASERRRVLLDLLDGPEDWITETAAFALVAVGWVEPAARADVGARLAERLAVAGRARLTREVTILGSLCRLVLLCPWLDQDPAGREATAAARGLLAELDAEEGQAQEPAPDPPAAPAGHHGAQPPAPARVPSAERKARAPRRGLFRRRRD
jgi:tetratricopeptide (TPR) repeat protein